jgi:hypothetical protein
MIDLLLPATDGGVFAQAGAVLIVGTVATVVSRPRREQRLVAIGGTVRRVWLISPN